MSARFRQLMAASAIALASSMAHASAPTIVYYDIAGNTPNDLRRELDAKGPPDIDGKRFDARTQWNVGWSYRYMPINGGCEITQMKVSLNGVITLPRWGGVENPGRLSKEWRRYLTALRLHEDGHYANGVSAAQDIDRLGQSFGTSHSCASIAGEFNRQANDIVEKYKVADSTYDKETDHGRTQGARFPSGS